MQVRTMVGLALAAVGGVCGMVLLMSGSVDPKAEALERPLAARAVAAGCVEAQMAELQPGTGCVVERQPWHVDGTIAAARPSGAAAPAAPIRPAARPSREASRPPTYIRIGGPEPEPDPVELALEALRGRI